MDRRMKQYTILMVFVMALFVIFVRGVVLNPKQTVAGPLITHSLEGRYEDRCEICHRKHIDFHKEKFGGFEKSNCMLCHGGAPPATHPMQGNETCMKCHNYIKDSHDAMFPSKKVSYENCKGCH